MKGDFSKDTFDARRHFSSVRLQQGRVVTDADWNEQADLTRHRSEREAWDVIGGCGAPQSQPGFALTPGTYASAVSAVGNDAWIVGEDGILLRTIDGGVSWLALETDTTTPLRAVRFASADDGWIAGDGGFVARTTNAGATWTAQDSGITTALLALAAFDANTAWAVGEGGVVLRTTDGGSQWIQSTIGAGRLYAVHFASATNGWIAGQDGRIWSTINGGATWTERPSGTTAHLRALAFASVNIGWAVGDAGTVLRTSDGGQTWTSQNSTVTSNLFAVAARTVSTVWAGGEHGALLRTTNGGTAWSAIDAGQGDATLRGAAMGTAPDGWLVGDNSTLIHLSGGSASLEPLPAVGLSIGPGRYYVKGALCEVDARASLHAQPDRYDVPRLEPGTHLVYLDVWQRHLTHLETPGIREIALGGPDTATRARTVWQVRTLPVSDGSPSTWHCLSDIPGWAALTAAPTARLRARAEPEQAAATLCELGAAGGFRRVENQLYRVEVQEAGAAPAFKWSRDCGSVAFAITNVVESAGKTTVTLASRGLDDTLDLVENGWVEVVDDAAVLEHGVGVLRRFIGNGNDPLEVVLDGLVGDVGTRPDRHPLLRRWDHRPSGSSSAIPILEGQWIALEDGVEVFFEPGFDGRPGDYWLIPARTALANVEWPRDEHDSPVARPPAGVEHAYCRLALVDVASDGAVTVTQDCRNLFPPLTALRQLLYVSGDGQDGIPGQPLPQPLRVRVARGETPIANAIVRFDVIDGAGSLTGASPGLPLEVPTGSDGLAECVWTLDADVDPAVRHQRVDATLLNAAGSSIDGQVVSFCATGSLALDYVSGDGQIAPAGTRLVHDLEVRVANGQQPIAGVEVHFAVTEGGGTLVDATPVATDANGIARMPWELGPSGPQRVEAEIRQAGGVRVQHLGFNATIERPDTGGGGVGCEITVGEGGQIPRLPENLNEILERFGQRVCLCLLPGVHRVDGLIASRRAILTIKACGPGSVLELTGSSTFEGLEYIEFSGMRLNVRGGTGMSFAKCATVVIRSVVATMQATRFALFTILASENATIDASTITVRDGIAVVFEDGPVTSVQLTNNRIAGAVSFYGMPNLDQQLNVDRLFGVMAAAQELNADETEIFLSDNSFSLLTLGTRMIDELNRFATGGAPPGRIHASGVLTNNVIRDNRSIFLAKLVALGSTSLMVQRRVPLSTFIADTAAVAGTVSIHLGDELPMFVITRRQRCDEAANVPLVRHN